MPAPLPDPPPVEAGALTAATVARREGRTAEAIQLYEQWLRAAPEDTDALVGLGYARLQAGDIPAAEAAFRKALGLAPEYDDARLGLARAALRRGDRAAADAELTALLARSPDNAEARALAAAPSRSLRLDLAHARSDLSAGLPDWRETTAAVSAPVGAATGVAVVQHAERFGREDVYLELGLSQRRSDGLAAAVFVGGAPDADFRPEALVRLELVQPGGRFSRTLALAVSRFADETVVSTSPGVAWRPGAGRLQLTARAVLLTAGSGLETGVTLGAEAPVGRLTLRANAYDTPETSEGRVSRARGVGVGVGVALSPTVSLRLDALAEDRGAYDRRELGLSLSRRF